MIVSLMILFCYKYCGKKSSFKKIRKNDSSMIILNIRVIKYETCRSTLLTKKSRPEMEMSIFLIEMVTHFNKYTVFWNFHLASAQDR